MLRLWQRRRPSDRTCSATVRRIAKGVNVEQLETRELLSGNSLSGLVTYHGGPLIQNVQVENVYYGKAWASDATLQSAISQLDGFTQFLPGSAYFDVLKQYNVGQGSFVDHDIVNADPASKTKVDDTQLRALLDSEITSGHLKRPNTNSGYVIYTAPGVVVTAGGQSSSRDFAGYHDTFRNSAGDTVYYSVIPYPTGNVVNANLTDVQQATLVVSHELSEMVTDPDTRSGWFSNARTEGEIGDLAAGKFGLLHGYVVQDVWSNQAGGAVLPSESTSSGVTVTGHSIDATAGKSFSNIIATFTSSTTASADSFTASIDWGDGQRSAGVITVDPNGGFDVTGTHNYSQSGTFRATVSVLDKSGHSLGSAWSEVSVTSTPTPSSQIKAKGVRVDATSGTAFTGTVATFTSASATAQAPNFKATIDWGDGTTSTGTIVVDSNGGFDVQGTHTYTVTSSPGPRWRMSLGGLSFDGDPASAVGNQFAVIRVSIQDTTTNAAARAFSLAEIKPTPPNIDLNGVNIKATAGQSFTGVVASFTDVHTDAQASQFTAAIDWGDGTTTTGVIAAGTNGGFTVTGTHTYAEAFRHGPIFNPFGFGGGTAYFVIHVSVSDATNNDAASSESLAAVAPAPPNLNLSVQNIQATAGTQFSGTVATFTDLNTKPGASDFSATIYWGDGTSSAGVVTANDSGGYTVTGTHTYQVSNHPGVIYFGDDGGGQASLGTRSLPYAVTIKDNTSQDRAEGHGLVTVSPAPSSVTAAGVAFNAVVGQAFTGTVATFTAKDASASADQFTATINWGDGTTSDGIVVVDPKGGFNVTGSHTYQDDSTLEMFGIGAGPGRPSGERYFVTVSVTNTVDNTTSTAVSLADVAPSAPKLTAAGQDITATAGQSFTGVVATFTDADGGTNPGAYRAVISWGDGRHTFAKVTVDANGGFDVSGTHTYAAGGSYSVYVSIQRFDGQSVVASSTAKVADKTSSTALNTVNIAFTQSAEYYANLVAKYYQQYLNRSAGGSEVQYWVGAMQHGATDEQVLAGFIGSNEFFKNSGGNSKAWVDALYRSLLNRSADSSGEAAWIKAVSSGSKLADIAYKFTASDERHGLILQGDYQTLLGRTAGSGEIGFWVNAFHAGATHEQILAGFVGSSEYYQNHNSNASDWLTGAYQDILQRQPDQAGFDSWLGVLHALSTH